MGAPVAASNATLLAPAEVVDKQKGELMDTMEKSETDRKRERREKKAKKSAIRKNKEKNKGKKDKALNSSTAFFSSLQDEVKTGAKEKAHAKKKKKTLENINVASLKL